MALKLCIAQLNLLVGDTLGNANKIVEASRRAYEQGARLVVTPELAISGYPAEDLWLRPAFMAACDDAVKHVARELAGLKGLHVVVGHPHGTSVGGRSVQVQRRLNAASVLSEGRVLETYAKRELPNYQVFDEYRYFAPGQGSCVFQVEGVNVGLLICEDAWFAEPAELAAAAGAEMLIVPNASPFHVGKSGERVAQMADRAQAVSLPLVYAHLVGGQDEVVFDGASFAVNADGSLAARASSFREELFYMDVQRTADGQPLRVAGPIAAEPSAEAELWDALVMGVRDYVGKNRFPGALLGLSGGIDSALTLAVAVDALGRDRVRALMLPSRYNASISLDDSREMAGLLGIRYDEIPIEGPFTAFLEALAGEFRDLPPDAAEENIQARIRGTLLMALSNKFGSIVLTTGNKSEMAVGYATLYGDMAGGFGVLKDIAKTLVYRLSNYRNTLGRVIPERIITRPPSAELRADQTDQDSLPPYEVLDAILEAYVEQDRSPAEIVAMGLPAADVRRVVRLIKIAEYKRRQSAVGIRITPRGFGKDWRYPITSAWNDWETLGS
jgi:NAD+ synthase (glutamine-hydrolysing)